MTSSLLFVQAPKGVVMIRPHFFTPNPATAVDNTFQASVDDGLPATTIAQKAYGEVTEVARILTEHGVTVHLFEDEGTQTPDSVFPNNWFSTHSGGHIAIYPMYSESRRHERRSDVIEMLKKKYRVQDVIDYSGLEYDNVFLEGTGAMVLDHIEHVAYAARSNRTDPIMLERFCTNFNYEPVAFDAADATGKAIYHTNVIMCIGTEYAMIGLDTLVNPVRRREIRERLESTGREVIALSQQQIAEFAGNAIELAGNNGRILAISSRALASLRPDQIETLERFVTVVPLSIPTIELAGGSVRCMLAGIHLAERITT